MTNFNTLGNYNNYSTFSKYDNTLKDNKNGTFLNNKEDCETCENRKYKDGSDDEGVSFKTPTNISPGASSQAVRGHEMEHVNRERASAFREGREIVSQTVTIKTSNCPECGKAYVSGGVTKTVTKAKEEIKNLDDEARRGQFIDTYI